MQLYTSLGGYALTSLLLLGSSQFAHAQDAATALQSCLTVAGVHNLVDTDAGWVDETALFNKRFAPDPASIAFPETRDQIALSLACARNASVKVTARGAAHSFAGFGYGLPGNLVVSMAAFNAASFDEATTLLTFEGGSRVGPVAKYLWDGWGRHFPHVRGSHVGLAGSSFGGGFGSTSRFLGTPMDNLESVEFMLWNGSVVTAGPGSELLWAAKGAAPSFGVVLSMTTRTHKLAFDTAVNFTLSLGSIDVDSAARALVAIQDFSLTGPDELAVRWSLAVPPYTNQGYFYGDPATFDDVMAPLLATLRGIAPNTTSLTKTELPFWDMEASQVAGAGMNQPGGGSLGGRSFYTQALTTTTDHPLTVPLAKTLLLSTSLAFNRTSDLRKSGFLDLWGGVSRDIKDQDTAYAHGKNLWLIRWEANAADINNFPADGTRYLKSLMLPFEQALTDATGGVPLRGFVNYPDSELSEDQWSSRLYGANFARLRELKARFDPEGLFVSHAQSIPLP